MSKKQNADSQQYTLATEMCVKVFGYLQVADFTSAEALARRVLTLSPDNPTALALLALALRGVGKFADALARSKQALELAPESPDYTFVAALCSWSSGDPKQARELFEKALQLQPKRTDMRLDYAGFLFYKQEFAAALEQLELVAELTPEIPKLAVLRTCCENHSWHADVDIPAFRPPLPLPADDAQTNIILGREYFISDYYDLSLDEASRALELSPSNKEAQALFATAFYYRENDFAAWCKNFRQRLFTPIYAVIAILLPALLFGGGCLFFSTRDNNVGMTACATLGLIWLLAVLFLRAKGGVRLAPEDFQAIIKAYHLTPQGREQQQKVLISDLGEEKKRKLALDTPTSGLSLPSASGTGQEVARVRGQLYELASRLRTTSITFSALAVLSFFVLIVAVSLVRALSLPFHAYLPQIKLASFLCTVVFACIALWFRHKAASVANRL